MHSPFPSSSLFFGGTWHTPPTHTCRSTTHLPHMATGQALRHSSSSSKQIPASTFHHRHHHATKFCSPLTPSHSNSPASKSKLLTTLSQPTRSHKHTHLIAAAMPPDKPPPTKDKSKVHKLSLKGSSRLVAEFVRDTFFTAQYCNY